MALYINTQTLKYPLSKYDVLEDIRRREIIVSANPDDATLSSLGYEVVQSTPRPDGYSEETQPEFVDGVWRQVFVEVPEPESIRESRVRSLRHHVLNALEADHQARLAKGAELTIEGLTDVWVPLTLEAMTYYNALLISNQDTDLRIMTTDHQLVDFDDHAEYVQAHAVIMAAYRSLTQAYIQERVRLENATTLEDLA